MKPAALGGHEDSRAAQVEAILALDRIERSAALEIVAASPFAPQTAPFRLDRDIVKDQISFLARAVSCFRETWQNSPF
ncbi:MAG: hypothetical protein DLM68_16565 [Hyphomicrobiales bacterium]|nr:MAG: hypothetical protein DLM68_16565 [Hyphomicrobiales bacterium]